MAKKFLTAIDLNKCELQNAVIQNLGTAPGSPNAGQIYFNSTAGDKSIYFYDGTAWVDLGGDFKVNCCRECYLGIWNKRYYRKRPI